MSQLDSPTASTSLPNLSDELELEHQVSNESPIIDDDQPAEEVSDTESIEENEEDSLYQRVLSTFEWDNCNITRITADAVADAYKPALGRLEWKNLDALIRATLPCLHTVDLEALPFIDVVALDAFVTLLLTALNNCTTLDGRYKITNVPLCDAIKKNIARFHPVYDGEPTEAERICGAYTIKLNEKVRREYTAAEKAEILKADAAAEERIRANAATRRRAQHALKGRVLKSSDRRVLKGRLAAENKEQVTTVAESTLFHQFRNAGTASTAILDKYLPAKAPVAVAPIDLNKIVAGASSVNIVDLVKRMELSGESPAPGSVTAMRTPGGKFVFNAPRDNKPSQGSIFSGGVSASKNIAEKTSRYEQSPSSENRVQFGNNNRDKYRDRDNVSEFANSVPIKWERGSSTEPVQASNNPQSNFQRGRSTPSSTRDEKYGNYAQQSPPINENEEEVRPRQSRNATDERQTSNSVTNDKPQSRPSAYTRGVPLEQLKQNFSNSQPKQANLGNSNRWSALNDDEDEETDN